MPYTVKQVSALSGVSVRTLHFYHQTGLLKPAYLGRNRYRFYEEPQLLTLQQILFYRELGFELKQIKRILRRADFEIVAALQSHRQVLLNDAARKRTLVDTIDKTIAHLKGTTTMKTEEIFTGFTVPAGQDRFGKRITLAGDPTDCKVSARDTNGAMCAFEFTGGGSGPKHLHHDQDEWIYVLDGECQLLAGRELLHLTSGQSAFIPRNTPHTWACAPGIPARILNTYQPAGNIEDFFRAVSAAQPNLPTREDCANKTFTEDHVRLVKRLFSDHGMDVFPPD